VNDLDFIRLGAAAFAAAPDISIDYAIAEKTDKAAVVPAAIGWSDVGSWSALYEIAPKDATAMSALGDVVLEGCAEQLCAQRRHADRLARREGPGRGDNQDAVLVAHKDQAQNVKKIVDRLKKMKRPEADTHNRTYRPWGFYESLIQGDRFQVKRIVVWPGAKLSLQKHFHRAEHWVVVTGCAIVTCDSETRWCMRMRASICRWAASTAWKTPVKSR
jgi:mannose-1-phosphate guanylyltransferase/mannose-6-phosphate isomerase